MKEIIIKKHIRYLFGVAFFVFILNKFYLRPHVLENDLGVFLQIFVLSIPNLVEAILGTLLLTGILLQARQRLDKMKNIKVLHIYSIAVGLSSIYVISQELKFHNLGGNNVYDPYDLIASIIGLLTTFAIIRMFGFADELKTKDQTT